jgi:hypothetical protein
MLLLLSLSALPAGQLLYLICAVQLVKSTRRKAQISKCMSGAFPLQGNFSILSISFRLSNRRFRDLRSSAQPMTAVHEVEPHPRRKRLNSQLREGMLGVALRLRGVRLLASPLPCGANK